MLKKDGNRSAEGSLQPSTVSTTTTAAVDSLGDKLNAINLSKGATSTTTSASAVAPIDDFDLNDMDDPLAGFEAQRSGIKDLSLKVTTALPIYYCLP
jgi:hypothetical protein